MKRIHRILSATVYSVNGIKAALKYEEAFREEIIIIIPLLVASLFLKVTNIERILLCGSLFLILIVELINSAIEAVVDRISNEHHDLSGRAKDLGSAAVFVCIILSFLTWIAILI